MASSFYSSTSRLRAREPLSTPSRSIASRSKISSTARTGYMPGVDLEEGPPNIEAEFQFSDTPNSSENGDSEEEYTSFGSPLTKALAPLPQSTNTHPVQSIGTQPYSQHSPNPSLSCGGNLLTSSQQSPMVMGEQFSSYSRGNSSMQSSSPHSFIGGAPSVHSYVLPTGAAQRSPPDLSNLMVMIQNQQAMLNQVLAGQKSMELRQEKLETDVASFRVELSKLSSQPSSSPSSSTDGKRKRVVTRSLSRKVYTVHSQLEPQFNATEMFSTTHNKQIQDVILKEILDQPDCEFGEKEIKQAIRRCYENTRRAFLEQRDGKEDTVRKQGQRRKYRSRRERRFQRRSSVVTKKEKEKYWQFLSTNYITEESDDPHNPNGIIEHKLEWHSEKLNSFMEHLDKRFAMKNSSCPAGSVAKKVRCVGDPSESLPPANAPSWAVKRCFTQDVINKENIPCDAQD